jgi:hypothetical protein
MCSPLSPGGDSDAMRQKKAGIVAVIVARPLRKLSRLGMSPADVGSWGVNWFGRLDERRGHVPEPTGWSGLVRLSRRLPRGSARSARVSRLAQRTVHEKPRPDSRNSAHRSFMHRWRFGLDPATGCLSKQPRVLARCDFSTPSAENLPVDAGFSFSPANCGLDQTLSTFTTLRSFDWVQGQRLIFASNGARRAARSPRLPSAFPQEVIYERSRAAPRDFIWTDSTET